VKYPTLLKTEVLTPKPRLERISKKFWVFRSFYHARFHTTEGVYDLCIHPGQVTDKRSGSDAINWLVPKEGNEEYNAYIYGHDTAYSGWISKGLADDLFIRQGFYKSKEVCKVLAECSYKMVGIFGKAYGMDDVMPYPYTHNRMFESLVLEAK